MSFFGIGKKKLDEQSREEQSAETAKAQKEQTSEDAPKSARLSEKIMEQQQWEDSLRRFVKSESTRHQNHEEEQSEEHRAVEDLKRALLHGDEKVEESSATDELTEEQAEEQERRSLLAALGVFPQEAEEPVEVEQVSQAQDVEEDDAPVAEAAQPATPAFLRDDEESAAEDASVEAQEPKDAAEDARSHFEEHLRALRAQNTEDAASEDTAVEDAEADADTAGEAEGREELEAVVEASENKSENAHSVSESAAEEASADAEDSLTVEHTKAARTRAAVTEALNAVTNDQVLITHGTDTMPETARYLLEHADLGNKVVVLTGAMQPAVMARSDAGFNLGAAIAALNLLEPGVYISMSGRIFPAESVRKDRSRGIFEG